MPIIQGATLSDYLATDGWGASSLRAFRIGPPARVMWELAHPHEDTDATILGSFVDAMLLEPGRLTSYAVKPDGMSFATKDGKAWREAHSGLTIVPHAIAASASEIAAAVTRKVAFGCDCVRQATVTWIDSASGEPCRGRPDAFDSAAVYDLKVSRFAGPTLPVAAYRAGWMHQLAHYRAGLRANDGIARAGRLVVVSPTPPHYVYLAEVKPDVLDLLDLENQRCLAQMGGYRKSDAWPDTPDTYALIEPPAWAVDMTTTEEE